MEEERYTPSGPGSGEQLGIHVDMEAGWEPCSRTALVGMCSSLLAEHLRAPRVPH